MVSKKHPVRKAQAKKRKKVIVDKPNPFDLQTTRVKHPVANARSTNSINLIRSRTEAVEKVITIYLLSPVPVQQTPIPLALSTVNIFSII